MSFPSNDIYLSAVHVSTSQTYHQSTTTYTLKPATVKFWVALLPLVLATPGPRTPLAPTAPSSAPSRRTTPSRVARPTRRPRPTVTRRTATPTTRTTMATMMTTPRVMTVPRKTKAALRATTAAATSRWRWVNTCRAAPTATHLCAPRMRTASGTRLPTSARFTSWRARSASSSKSVAFLSHIPSHSVDTIPTSRSKVVKRKLA